MPSISLVTEIFSEWLREQRKQRKRCVIAGYFPVVGPSFDEDVPWDVQVLDEVISVYVRDETLWEKIKNGQTVKKGDYLKAVIVHSNGQNVAIKAEITDSERVSSVVETLFLNSPQPR